MHNQVDTPMLLFSVNRMRSESSLPFTLVRVRRLHFCFVCLFSFRVTKNGSLPFRVQLFCWEVGSTLWKRIFQHGEGAACMWVCVSQHPVLSVACPNNLIIDVNSTYCFYFLNAKKDIYASALSFPIIFGVCLCICRHMCIPMNIHTYKQVLLWVF